MTLNYINRTIDGENGINIWQCLSHKNSSNYTIWLANNIIIWEWVYFLNAQIYMQYFTLTKQIKILMPNQQIIDLATPMEELTLELANQWMERLKGYLIYH